jgi:hypothetical protein
LKISIKKQITTWRWRSNANLPLSDFGDPVNTDSYSLCIYAGGSLVEEMHAAAGGTCPGGQPCWKARSGKGFRFKDHSGAQSGLSRIVLRAGPIHLADLVVRARGPNVPYPSLPLAEPVEAQLVRSAGAECWEADYQAPPLKNTTQVFLDKNN